MIEVDGSSGEGGGQILRTAVALSSVLGIEVRITKIRAGRSTPGIRAQHLAGVKVAAEICGGIVKGAEVGSTTLEYTPGEPKSGRFSFDVGTAGSVTLILQTVMPILSFAGGNVELHLIGGTDVKWSPPIDYLRLVTLPILSQMGFKGNLKLVRRGYYPNGGGEVEFSSSHVERLGPVNGTSSGTARDMNLLSFSTGLPRHVAERIASSAGTVISDAGLPAPRVTLEVSTAEHSPSAGCGVVLCSNTDHGALVGADCLGERGKPAEEVGTEAGRRLVEELGSGMFLDRHMGDMVVPYMALADGVSEVSISRLTEHTLTNVKVAEELGGVRFEVNGKVGEPGSLRVKGLGFSSSK